MALVVKDRVKETTTTTGTGTVTLAGAPSGYQSFSVIGDSNTTYYAITSGNDWEVGIGTYTASGTTLSRDTILESSNAGSAITLSGTSDVFCTYPAERSVNTADIGVSVQAYDADTAKYDDTTANFTGTLQNGGSNVVVDTDIGSTVQGYDANTAKYNDATANFTGTLQNGGSNVVVDTDIGSTVEAYSATNADYSDTTANFTGTLQNGGSNVVVDSDIGSTVQAYDADTAKYDDVTANFIGTLQNGGSNVVVDSDIGSTVQAYDATIVVDADIGVTVQGYDADTLKADTADTLTAPFRGAVTTDNDLSFDLNVTNNFSCTPSSGAALTFTNHTSGQSGYVLLDNSAGVAITAAATTKITATDLTTISTAGVYLVSYFDNGTNAYCTVSASYS